MSILVCLLVKMYFSRKVIAYHKVCIYSTLIDIVGYFSKVAVTNLHSH